MRLVVSFADCDQNHLGTIYQATNWIYTGVPESNMPQFVIHGKATHNRTAREQLRKYNATLSIENIRKYLDPHG